MKKEKLTMANVLVIAITIIIGLAFTANWEDFKKGLQGAPPVETSQQK